MSHYKYINDCNMSCDYASRKQRMLGQIFAVCMIIDARFLFFFYRNYITLTNNSSCEHLSSSNNTLVYDIWRISPVMRNAILKLNNSREKLKNFWNYPKDRYNNRIEDNMKYSFWIQQNESWREEISNIFKNVYKIWD